MCGVAGLFGTGWQTRQLAAMVACQRHRGPDAQATFCDPTDQAKIGHDRLSILDLSPAGAQPMTSVDGRFVIAFNGEIYNYLELRAELTDYPFRSRSDTEVILAAYARWGERCLDRFVGMFALLIWDRVEQRLFAARDRFGVKPLYYRLNQSGSLAVSSEIKAFRAADLEVQPNAVAWATYLKFGIQEHSEDTFWVGIKSLPGGCRLTWRPGHNPSISRWYDLADHVGQELDERSDSDVEAEYVALLEESVRLRFRSDVPVGVNLSGGLDSSLLLGLVHAIQGPDSDVSVFSFATNDPLYDELPWVERMLDRTRHPLVKCTLTAEQVPKLASSVQDYQQEPFGGIPTLAYARVFEEARARGIIVLLDGQGMDEQWAGYDYYRAAAGSDTSPLVQGTSTSPVRPDCLRPEFAALAEAFESPSPFPDKLRNLQYRDALYTKIPRALRFNDRVSMRASTELREPFLDHRLFELALRQPQSRKVQGNQGKWLLRRIAKKIAPRELVEAPKRPLQTPQREWLRGPLSKWARELIAEATTTAGGGWLDRNRVETEWKNFQSGEGDNSFFVWQWVNLGLAAEKWD